MRLSELARGLPMSPDDVDPEITGITEDSRRIRRGMLFVAHAGELHSDQQGARPLLLLHPATMTLPGRTCNQGD